MQKTCEGTFRILLMINTWYEGTCSMMVYDGYIQSTYEGNYRAHPVYFSGNKGYLCCLQTTSPKCCTFLYNYYFINLTTISLCNPDWHYDDWVEPVVLHLAALTIKHNVNKYKRNAKLMAVCGS